MAAARGCEQTDAVLLSWAPHGRPSVPSPSLISRLSMSRACRCLVATTNRGRRRWHRGVVVAARGGADKRIGLVIKHAPCNKQIKSQTAEARIRHITASKGSVLRKSMRLSGRVRSCATHSCGWRGCCAPQPPRVCCSLGRRRHHSRPRHRSADRAPSGSPAHVPAHHRASLRCDQQLHHHIRIDLG